MSNPVQNTNLNPAHTEAEETISLDFDVEAGTADGEAVKDEVLQNLHTDDVFDEMEEIDGDLLLSEMDDIEAELLALREQLESETSQDDEVDSHDLDLDNATDTNTMQPENNDDFATSDIHTDSSTPDTAEIEHTDNTDTDDVPEPAMDSFAAFAAELFEEVENHDYGVNSQRFKPDDFDIASQTAEIAPVQLDEDELETIDGSDLEALFGLSDDYTPSLGNNHSFLADAAQLDAQDDLPNLLPSTEEFTLDEEPYQPLETDNLTLDEVDDMPDLSAHLDNVLGDIETETTSTHQTGSLKNLETVNTVNVNTDEIELDIFSDEPAPAVAPVEETVAMAPAVEPEAATRKGLDLSDDGDDPMAWLDKMKNEMASKFDINIDKEVAALNHHDTAHLYDNLEEFDDKTANLGDNLNKLPEFDETQLDKTNETDLTDSITLDMDDEPVVKRPAPSQPVSGKSIEEVLQLRQASEPAPREVDTNISLDDIWADTQGGNPKVDLTAAPLDEAELELFDESTLDLGTKSAERNDESIDLEMDFSFDTPDTPDRQPENISVSAPEAVETVETVDLSVSIELESEPVSEPTPEVRPEVAQDKESSDLEVDLDLDLTQLDDLEALVKESTREAEAASQLEPDDGIDIVEEEIDFANAITDAMTEVSVQGMDDLERVSAEITEMEDFVSPKTKLMELMEAEPEVAEAATMKDILANSKSVDVDLSLDDGLETVETVQAASEVIENIEISTDDHTEHSVLNDVAHALKDKAHELEMRGEILVHEVGDALRNAEEWVEHFTDAVADKVEELELGAEMLAHDVVQSAKAALHLGDNDSTLPENQPDTVDSEISMAELDAMLQSELDNLETLDLTDNPITQTEETQPENSGSTEIATETEEVNLPVAEAAAAVGAAAAATVATTTALSPDELEADKRGWASRLKAGLTKSRNQMAKSLAGVFGGGKIDEDLYEELETTLLISDMGIEATEQLMKEVRNRVSLKGLKDGAELRSALKEAVYDLLKPLEKPLEIPNNGQPFVIMMAGINGAGKTTSIGKLAKYFQAQGKSVMLAAGDTFRAAAREQLQEWGARNGVTVISQASGDSAAVCFDAVESAKAKGIDVVLADTAGRLPTQLHLMEEIKKVKRVLQKAMPDAPHEIMVVLDANIGQNAINQVVAFDDALGVTGLIVTKLDGTAKGGVLAALASNRPIPVRYIGVGEGIDDLRPFDARAFVDALLDEADN